MWCSEDRFFHPEFWGCVSDTWHCFVYRIVYTEMTMSVSQSQYYGRCDGVGCEGGGRRVTVGVGQCTTTHHMSFIPSVWVSILHTELLLLCSPASMPGVTIGNGSLSYNKLLLVFYHGEKSDELIAHWFCILIFERHWFRISVC